MGYLSVDHPSPALKQLPTAVAFAIAIVLILSVPGIEVTHEPLAAIGIALMVAATMLAAVLTRVPRLDNWAIIIPLIDFLAIGAFRAGTGGVTSFFSSLLVLPVVWIAAERGRRHIVIAGIGTSFALFMPFMLGLADASNFSETFRGIYSPFVFAPR